MEISAGRTSGAPAAEWTGTSPAENGSAGRKTVDIQRSISSLATQSTLATRLSFLVPDVLAFLSVVLLMRGLPGGAGSIEESFLRLMPVGVVLAAGFAVAGLYRAEGFHPVEELRRVGIVTTVVFAVYGGLLVIDGNPDAAVIGFLVLACMVCVIVLTGLRAFARILFAKTDWWGAPVAILGSNGGGKAVIKTLKQWPEIGLTPTVVFDEASEKDTIEGVPVVSRVQEAPQYMAAGDIPFMIVAMSRSDRLSMDELIRCCSQWCKKVLVIPEIAEGGPLWTHSSYCRGLSGYEIQHGRNDRIRRTGKRIFDTVVAALLLVVLAPLLLAIALLIKLDSPGPIFYSQWRMGLEGRCFHTYKFRSMYTDAEERLMTLLADDSEKRREYEQYHKLNSDPRVTKIGRLLRRYSLDELPQLWNVVIGDMSLVGPRAYMPRELSDMGGVERTILQTRPGISGLWQVSGRNALSFAERTRLDVHYVHNWSPWLDIYILARTIPVVCSGEGAI